jgi:NAD(P) transhydrogenase subunit alpha
MKVGIPKEIHRGERRVAATPDTTRKLIKLGFEVLIQAGAGEQASLNDEAYVEAGATIVKGADEVWSQADIVLKVRPPEEDPEAGLHEVDRMREGGFLVSLIFPSQAEALIERLAERKASAIAIDQIPRISRAQKMDVLSSMANIAGYRAVIEAANHFGSFFGGQITAAGKTRPARVLVIGAGVAGLAAIAAARGLGAEVRAFDVRPAVKEQVQSLGAKFLDLKFKESETAETSGGYAKAMSKEFIDAEMALFRKQCKEVDIVITTALIPGKPAPKLITRDMVDAMRPGSIVVDLAAEQGGNCGYTQPDRAVEVNGVTIIGYTDLTSRLATHASQFFGTNLVNLLSDMGGAEGFKVDLDDEVVRNSLVLKDGAITWPPPPEPDKAVPAPPTREAPQEKKKEVAAPAPHPMARTPEGLLADKRVRYGAGAAAVVALSLMGAFAPLDFIQHFTVFVLACFIGWQVVWNVTPALHTPLMSVTNAISGICRVGGMLQAASGRWDTPAYIGAAAILVASINIAGGFLVTRRMLEMFRK